VYIFKYARVPACARVPEEGKEFFMSLHATANTLRIFSEAEPMNREENRGQSSNCVRVLRGSERESIVPDSEI